METQTRDGGRRRNRRGEGRLLREEILAATTTILEREGGPEALTLRAIAREAGIATPSIYPHFPDLKALLEAVLDTYFDQLSEAVSTAGGNSDDPVERLLEGSRGYAEWALQCPARYRALFGRRPDSGITKAVPRLDVFQVLVDGVAACAEAGRSDSTDPFADAVEVWSAMHGAVTLRMSSPPFPWPPLEQSLETIVRRLARLT